MTIRASCRLPWYAPLLLLGCSAPAADSTPDPGQPGTVTLAEPGPWRHLSMDDLSPDLERFRPIRGRYLQVMYDLEGREEVQSRTVVHLDLDQTIHSGPWEGQTPVVLNPHREPGLRVAWQVQNTYYTGFDRVLTDRRLSLWERAMPAGIGGLRVGAVKDGVHSQVKATPNDSSTTRPPVELALPEGAVNILTLPYVLAAMDLQAGDRFTLPGYAMIGGPQGEGTPWRGAFAVRSVTNRTVKGRTVPVAEVILHRMDERNGLTVDDLDPAEPLTRATRLLISPEAPYLLGRASFMVTEDGDEALVREYLGLVDWADQPLPLSDYNPSHVWEMDPQGWDLLLKPEHTPDVLLSLRDR